MGSSLVLQLVNYLSLMVGVGLWPNSTSSKKISNLMQEIMQDNQIVEICQKCMLTLPSLLIGAFLSIRFN